MKAQQIYANMQKLMRRLLPFEIDDVIRVMIEDKGKGFELNDVERGVGLFSIEERVRAAGGILSIQSIKGRGAKIILEIP
ncbi:hypothetical protein KHA94_23145 [Bacillus sp. FJAT-49705]|uniref:Histidine kinase/HSP90-like ATPase domain-containing protein n=1 Tax=Cytobacillus citreus TaxID=2833586 RepID=A0ABS5P062_9BACI|nr:hypothetical protein [Cytobacillus citreus]MBS4193013.1 hypothetical protein [Cytobacillus citreus]